MQKLSPWHLIGRWLLAALVLCAGCQKKTETAVPASPSPNSATDYATSVPALPIGGPITPAVVDQNAADSFTHYLHFPKPQQTARRDCAVQFYCDLGANGMVETTHALVAEDQAYTKAVQAALDWGRFKPATINSKPVPAYIGGTVLFFHQNEAPVIVVSLVTQERERVAKMGNYIQPQLLGALRPALESAIINRARGVVVGGHAEVVVEVDEKGAITRTSGVREVPKGSGLSELLEEVVKSSRFTPAYQDAKPTRGAINVVANFAK